MAGDAAVNAANGGGIDGAVHRAAGKERLQEACRELGGCDIGDAKVTEGFDLPAQWIIQASARGGAAEKKGEAELLASAYRRSLEEAARVGASTVAFPAISTRVYEFPPDHAAGDRSCRRG